MLAVVVLTVYEDNEKKTHGENSNVDTIKYRTNKKPRIIKAPTVCANIKNRTISIGTPEPSVPTCNISQSSVVKKIQKRGLEQSMKASAIN